MRVAFTPQKLMTGRMTPTPRITAALALIVAGAPLALAQVAPRRGFGNDMPPGGSGSFNPTGPSPFNPPGAIAPMPPGGSGSFNPTGPLPGAPPGYIHPMPPGGAGSFTPTAPPPQPDLDRDRRIPSYGVNSPRRLPPSRGRDRAEVGPGLDNCIKGYNPKRGLSRKEHETACLRIWKRRPGPSDLD